MASEPLLRRLKMTQKDTTPTMVNTPFKKLVISIIVVLAVAFAWSLGTQFSQTALKIHPEHFNAPYCMMWFSTNFMMFCYPVYIVYELIRGSSIRDVHEHAQLIFGSRGLTAVSLFRKVIPFLILWIGANYAYSRALIYVSASIATSISSCNAAIVYFLAILILGDRIHIMKIISVLFAVAGVVVISLNVKGSSGNEQWLGIVCALASACCSATYKVVFKKLVGNADLGQVSLFMTCLGYLNFSINWLPPVILTSTGVELVEWDWVPWLPMVGAACLSLLFNFLLNFGIALLHPLVISVGMLLGIPLNTTIDVLFRHVHATGYFLGGTALICVSFLLIIFPYDMVCKKSISSQESQEETIKQDDELIERL